MGSFQVAGSHLRLLVFLSFSTLSRNCRNAGVYLKNSWIYFFMVSCSWGDWLPTAGNFDLLCAMAITISSFSITFAAWSLGSACGGWAGSLGTA